MKKESLCFCSIIVPNDCYRIKGRIIAKLLNAGVSIQKQAPIRGFLHVRCAVRDPGLAGL